jgi:CubicO group peptidase (beta-lactamase class C family)
MSIRLLCLTVALLCLSPPGGSKSGGAQPAGKLTAIQPAMQAFVDKGEAAGIVTLIATRDSIVHIAAVGKTDLAKSRAMQTDDIFWIASMTKPIAAVAAAMLVDDAKLGFDDAVMKYVPEFGSQTLIDGHKPSRQVTLRDLLRHTSGIDELGGRDPHATLEQTGRLIGGMPLFFNPGTQWKYSTAAIDAVGRVVEVAGGMPFDRFVQQRIFDPLGMKETTFWIAPEKEARVARSYRWLAQENRLRETVIPYMYGTVVTDRRRPPLGGAGLFSTAENMARFYQMMLNKGTFNGKRLLRAETVDMMTRRQTDGIKTPSGLSWGLGLAVVENPRAMQANRALSPGSFGHGGAFSTQSWADPVRNVIWILMLQRIGKDDPDDSDVRVAFHETGRKGLGF